MYNDLFNDSLPMGFGMALAANAAAYQRFSALSDRERAALMEQTHGISSRDEMRRFVDGYENWKLS